MHSTAHHSQFEPSGVASGTVPLVRFVRCVVIVVVSLITIPIKTSFTMAGGGYRPTMCDSWTLWSISRQAVGNSRPHRGPLSEL